MTAASAVAQRWAATRDLADALEDLGVVAVVKGAEQEGRADALEDELFGFGRLVEENPGLEPQIAHLRDLVGEFRLAEFLAALEDAEAHAAG